MDLRASIALVHIDTHHKYQIEVWSAPNLLSASPLANHFRMKRYFSSVEAF